RQRVASMSSMRSRKRPPRARARSKLSSAENAWPRCRKPFGLGAKRRMGVVMTKARGLDNSLHHAALEIRLRPPERSIPTMTLRLEPRADGVAGVRQLRGQAPRLEAVAAVGGRTPLRRRAGGFAGLAQIIVNQQLSTASANAIWARL